MSAVKGLPRDTGARAYHSPLREERARRTRHDILTAAQALFVERGFARVSVADIAVEAGVARATVLSVFTSKAALLRAVVDVAMAGDDEPVPIAQRSWFVAVWEATNQADCLEAYARACTRIGRQSAEVIELVRRAADESPENADIWDQLQTNRRHGARTVAAHVHRLGPLKRGVTRARAADLVYVLNDTGLYRVLVGECGWGDAAFTAWLSDRMRHGLVGDGSTPTVRARRR
jgi:AcrR family transcriptional regulator